MSDTRRPHLTEQERAMGRNAASAFLTLPLATPASKACASVSTLLDEVNRLRAENERQAGEIERLRALVPKPPKFAACVTPGCGDEDLNDLDQTTGLCGMCEREAAILGKAVPRG